MTDIIDAANERAELHTQQAIAIRAPEPVVKCGTGICLNCAVPLHDSRRWCSAVCRDEYLKSA